MMFYKSMTIILFLCFSFLLFATEISENLTTPDVNWKYNSGHEFPGAKGSFVIDSDHCFDGNPTLQINADFTGGGAYVGVDRKFTKPLTVEKFCFKIQTPARKINLRFFDSAGRVYQKEYLLSGNPDEIQELSVKRFGGAEGFATWGPGKPADFVQPMTQYTLTIHRTDFPDNSQWSTRIGNIRLTYSCPVKVQASGDAARWLIAPGAEIVIPISGEPTEAQCKYQLFGYGDDKPLFSGTARFEQSALHFKLPNKQGFYEISLPELGWRGGVIAAADYTGKPDRYFAMDAAFSIFSVYNNQLTFESAVTFLKRIGISAVRDRLTWGTLEREPGKFNWGLAAGNGETIRDYCQSAGLEFLDVCHDAPAWTGAESANKNIPTSPYPANLQKTVESWQTIGKKWSDKQSKLEVWNEPEIGFGNQLPGDQVIAVHRAVAFAFQQAGIKTQLVGGVFTGFFRDPEIITPYIANGLLEMSDALSFHDYQTPLQFEKMITDFRTLVNNESIPFIISECGKSWPRGGDRAPVEADRISGAWIAAKAIEGKACGVSQFYTFIYYFYNENQNNFGMMDRNFTPMRSMAAYANAIRELSHFEYVGDITVNGADRARVFARDNKVVITLYSDRNNTIAELPLGLRPENITGIDGRALPLPDGNKIPISDQLIYIHTSRSAVQNFLNQKTTAMQLYQIARNNQPRVIQVHPLVYQFKPNLKKIPYNNTGYLLDEPQIELTFAAHNLGNTPLSAQPQFVLPENAVISEVPKSLELAPHSSKEFTVTLNLKNLPQNNRQFHLKLTDGKTASGAVIIPFKVWQVKFLQVSRYDSKAEIINPATPATDGWHPITNWKAWESKQKTADIEGSMRFFYTDTGLEIQILVRDTCYHQPYTSEQAWRGDSVQIAFQPLYNNRIPVQDMTEITAAMTIDGPALFCNAIQDKMGTKALKKSRLTFTATPGWQLYRIELDASEFKLGELIPGKRIGLSALVNSNNGEARQGYLEWGGGIGDTKNPRLFNQLTLE